MKLSKEEKERYSRQLPVLKEKGQEKVNDLKVLVSGVGGIGGTAAEYLVRLGIGEIRLLDPDTVELSNLNRQILYNKDDIGRNKVDVAFEKLKKVNPNVDIEPIPEKLRRDNLHEIFGDMDAFVDGLDNMQARYLANKECVKKDIPYFHAACEGFESRLTTIIPNETPCLNCIYGGKIEIKEKEYEPTVGVVPGKIGIIEVEQLIKYFLDLKGLFKDKLVIFDEKNIKPRIIDLRKKKNCEVCGSID
ncbi:MAG: Dinucleotide-utilizing enzyme involved in molybdopterin and thiamine biosynthesis ThiF [Candidatus Methanohalarchaeum thermophilum]|uniref:Dinucleotide-utilizing enzyme involved in molybdopterin and thiamine biosynthesis ThiF n=1 Tax=Methanohalarchaeum thermophilum TaxID=1903181 RepID=A0A1Q6DU45_METT1|nr:MAG: Dinucleotide-utilizing enzyme involved in molybdopterin and thiamine biosynthesis ThiF [Candidatus Methanohalarchaeum thermophilum]